MTNYIKTYALYVAWTASLVATLGSLYFSEIANYPPCVLCWYQRIAMYPLVIILGFAIYTKNKLMILPALVMSVIGGLIAVYHNLLYYNILPEAAAPCIAGVSCTTKYIEWLGFITIPLLALIGFVIITILLIVAWRTGSGADQSNQVME